MPNLIPGSNDWGANQQAVEDMIASPGYFRDWYPQPDRVAKPDDPYHADDCVADFEQASRGDGSPGASNLAAQVNGLLGYSQYKGYFGATAHNTAYYSSLWTEFVSYINNMKPVEFLVDTDGNGTTDHFATIIGYDDTPGALQFAAYNTWDRSVHWYNYNPVAPGISWGVYGGTFFSPPSSSTATWAINGDGNWSDGSKWTSGTAPDGVDSTAYFSTNLTADRTVHLDVGRTVGTMFFYDTVPTHDWTLVGPGALKLSVSTGTPQITVNNRTATISAGVSGAQGLSKSGAGTLALTGKNTYTGTTTIAAGALRAANGVGLPTASNLVLGGGVFEGNGAATFGRALGTAVGQVRWGAGVSGGFSANGGKLTVNLGGQLTPMTFTWGSTAYFVGNGYSLVFGSSTADSEIEFQNSINLNGNTRIISVNDNPDSPNDMATAP
jgi:autotransporter-associated beta strand protein